MFEGVEKIALALISKIDIDSFYDEVLIYNKGKEPIDTDDIYSAFLKERKLEYKFHKKISKELEYLDKQVPAGFRGIIFHDSSKKFALNLYRSKGVLSLSLFEPFKGTLAYPKTEQEAINYFDNKYDDTSKEAYFLVGGLLDKGLLQ